VGAVPIAGCGWGVLRRPERKKRCCCDGMAKGDLSSDDEDYPYLEQAPFDFIGCPFFGLFCIDCRFLFTVETLIIVVCFCSQLL
jgi:hypothetical protein